MCLCSAAPRVLWVSCVAGCGVAVLKQACSSIAGCASGTSGWGRVLAHVELPLLQEQGLANRLTQC